MKKSIFSIAVVTLMLSFLSLGCGGDVDKNSQEKGNKKIVEQLKQKGKIVVGTEAMFVPFEFIEDGKIVGYGSDILAEITKEHGIKLEQFDVPFSGIFTGLEAKKFDVIATAVAVTKERQEKYGLTIPIAENAWVAVTLKDYTEIKKLEDLNGKIIGCNLGSGPEKELIKYNDKLKAEGKEGFEIKTYPSNPEAFLDLKNGRVDAVLTVRSIANVLMLKEPDTLTIQFPIVDKLYTSWAVRKEDKELLDFLNAEISRLKKNGKLTELQQKWFGMTWDLPDNLPN